jgi:hypothetical protein
MHGYVSHSRTMQVSYNGPLLLTSQHLTSPSLLIRTDYFEFLGIQSGW